MTDEIEKPQTNWVRIALIASLALNLLIAGLVAGAMSRGPDGGHMREMVDGDGFRALAWAMPPEHRRGLGRDLFQRREEFGATRDQMNAARDALASALTASPFDIAAVEAAFASQKQILTDIADEGYKAVIARIVQMSAGERAEYAENLSKRGHR